MNWQTARITSSLVLILVGVLFWSFLPWQSLAAGVNLQVHVDNGSSPPPVSGCTDSSATNYNSSATSDDGSCTYSSGGPTPPTTVIGCTDSAANNYNSSATVDDGSCEYPPPPQTIPNVTNFSATYSALPPGVSLSWQIPVFDQFASVRIVRRTDFFPSTPNDGELIYQGQALSFFDPNVLSGIHYFYTAFVLATGGQYSSGAVATVSVPSVEEEPISDEEPPPDEDTNPPDNGGEPPGNLPGDIGPGGGAGAGSAGGGADGRGDFGGTPTDPFASLPQVIDPSPAVQRINLGDFVFSQSGERPRFFRLGSRVPVATGKDIIVTVDADRLPQTFKNIGLTLVNQEDPKKASSFLLHFEAESGKYVASIGSIASPGVYDFGIYILNFSNQTIKKLVGQLVASGPPGPIAVALRTAVDYVGQPIVITVGLGAGLSQGLSLIGHLQSLPDFYLILLHFWSVLLRVLGIRRRFNPWGVVYDSVTKRPLDPAYVVLEREGDEAGTAITDLDGRYGFFPSAGVYKLVANKTHYTFPSTKLAGRSNDELYEDLYFGDQLSISGGEVINRNIPLDPVSFDWNEFAKNQKGFFILHSRREKRRYFIYSAFFWFGLTVAIYQLIFNPGWINILVMVLYLSMFFLKYFWRKRRRFATIKLGVNGLPVPFAIVRAFVAGMDQPVKSVVADELGRFFLLTPPGEYSITVEEKLPDETYRKIYQSAPMNLAKGVLSEDIVV